MNDNLVELKNVTKCYGKDTIALNDVTLSLPRGKIIGLLGPNGSGKTTLIKTIMRIIRQQKGEITICGLPANYETRKYVSFMPDREFLYETMKVSDAIQYYKETFENFNLEKAQELCQELEININAPINKLSKGNKEKVVLMLTLARNVPIYLLDEPLGSLDPVIKTKMLKTIKKEINKDKVILISTHLVKDTEEILDEVIFLKEGHIAYTGSVKDIRKNEKTVEQYYLEVFTNA